MFLFVLRETHEKTHRHKSEDSLGLLCQRKNPIAGSHVFLYQRNYRLPKHTNSNLGSSKGKGRSGKDLVFTCLRYLERLFKSLDWLVGWLILHVSLARLWYPDIW